MDRSFQRLMKILMIASGQHIMHLTALIDPDPLTLPVFQINRRHNTVTGFEDCCKLHIPKRQRVLLPYALIHILQCKDRIILGSMPLAEIGNHIHITVLMILFSPPLAEHIRLIHGSIL